jgi:dienelactone hydrolase
MRSPLPLALLILLSVGSTTGAQPPAAPVVIYLHGRIIEEQGPDAVSPEFGAYGYHAILDSLRAGGLQVVSDLRPRGADMDEFAARVVLQIDSLLKAGVAPALIAVVGFSKGGGIAMLASARLRRTDITFVFLASCGEANAGFDLRGRLLSIYEESDPLGRSCSAVFARTPKGSVHSERRIATGLKHGAFYQPRSEWLEPVRAWVHGNQ